MIDLFELFCTKKNSSGFIGDELRGKHTNHRTVGQGIKVVVQQHNDSIPRNEAPYLRAQTSQESWRKNPLRPLEGFALKLGNANILMYSRKFNKE